MDSIRKPLSVVLGLMALVVLFHFVFNPLYEDVVDPISVWSSLNWMMAVGVIITLALTYIRRGRLGADSATTTHICVNVAFYTAVVLAILFFWNWFDDLTVGEEGQSQTRGYYWVVINVTFVVLLGTVSARLWKGDRGAADSGSLSSVE